MDLLLILIATALYIAIIAAGCFCAWLMDRDSQRRE